MNKDRREETSEESWKRVDEATMELAEKILIPIQVPSIWNRISFKVRYRFWYFVHNVLAHPLLALTPSTWDWPDKFHDWSGGFIGED